MIQLFACDLDGTLLNEAHEFDEIILNAIDEVIQEKKYFAIATGRHMHKSHDDMLKLEKKDIYIICMNGAVIFNPDGEVIYKKELDKIVLKDLLETFPFINFECIGMEHVYIRKSREEHLKQFEQRSIWNKAIKKSKIESFLKDCIFDQSNEQILSQDIMKLNCRVDDITQKEQLLKYIDEHQDQIVNAPFDSGAFEITMKGVNKREAVSWLAQLLKINEEEVAVYGDGGNDLEMLSRFKYSYATSNALDEAKTAAGNIIGNCKDYAVPDHILKTLREDK